MELVDNIEIDKKNISPPDEVVSPLCNDLNTSEAFAVINEIAKKIISSTDEKEKKQLKIKLTSSCEIFGILQKNPKKWLNKDKIEGDFDVKLIEKLINDRHLSRLDKDFDKADQIREELSTLGIDIEDTSDGTIWKAKIK